MTFVIRRRGALTQRMRAMYECIEHGGFDALVVRIDNGDPPATFPCPVEICGHHGELRMSAPLTRVKRGEVKRGKSDERPPGVLNTEPLADGVSMDEWAKSVDNETFDERRKTVRQKMGL